MPKKPTKQSVCFDHIAKFAKLVPHASSEEAALRLKRQYELSRQIKLGGESLSYGLASMVPNALRVKMKYVDRITPTPASGANFTQVYRANGLYDPDLTGTGHQPYGYDEISAMYSAYHVRASRIHIFCIDNSASSAPAQWEAALIPTATSSDFTSADPETVAEAPYGRAKIMGVHTGNPANNHLEHEMSVARLYGINPVTIGPGAVDWQATVGASPANGFYWVLNGQVIDESTTMANVIVYVEIVYDATFLYRKALGPS